MLAVEEQEANKEEFKLQFRMEKTGAKYRAHVGEVAKIKMAAAFANSLMTS